MAREGLGNLISKLLMPVWAVALLLVISSLMVGHWVTLPHPEVGTHLDTTKTAFANADKQVERALHAFHFLYGSCPCSRRVLNRVVDRNVMAGVNEHIVLIGQDPEMETRARQRGYRVETITPEELKTIYGVEAAPLLMVTNGDGKILYAGGYTSRKQGLDIQDEALIQRIVDGEHVEGLPLYGCAVSKGLKAIIDPLNLKN